ncbi:hypothetical protein D3C76_1698170 [compost metagenome]
MYTILINLRRFYQLFKTHIGKITRETNIKKPQQNPSKCYGRNSENYHARNCELKNKL